MALNPNRHPLHEDISYFVNSITGPRTDRMEAGGILSAVPGTPGSGAAMDSSAQAAHYATNPSGAIPLGMCMIDFVNIDQSRQWLNPYKDEAQIGTKAVIMRKGWAVTNMLEVGACTGNVPTTAYLGASGLLTDVNRNVGNSTAYPVVGRFLSRRDSDGFAKVYIDLA
jgi:hypothetical protein